MPVNLCKIIYFSYLLHKYVHTIIINKFKCEYSTQIEQETRTAF